MLLPDKVIHTVIHWQVFLSRNLGYDIISGKETGRILNWRMFRKELLLESKGDVMLHSLAEVRGSVVVKALCYESEGRGFDTR
jgi:hypothetical protein